MHHFFQTIEGWFTYPHFYQQLVKQAKSDYHFVEVGTWKGKSAAFMAVEIINSGKNIKFDCVDTWNGSIEHHDINSPFYEPLLLIKDGLYNQFLENINPVKNLINPIRSTSFAASELYNDKTLNCVFIDASHEYQDVYSDIKNWMPKIKKGGILAGHDFSYGPVREALKDALGDGYIDFGEDVWIYKL
jgi:hypothetical protein